MKPHSIKLIIKETNINYHGWSLVADGFNLTAEAERYLGIPTAAAVMIIKDDDGLYGVDWKNWVAIGEKLFSLIESEKFPTARLEADHEKCAVRLFGLADEVLRDDLSKAGVDKIRYWLDGLWGQSLKLSGLGLIPVVSDFEHLILSSRLVGILKQKNVRSEKTQEFLSLLISNNIPGVNWEQYFNLLKLAQKYGSLASVLKSGDFLRHVQRYEWANYGYQGPLWKRKDFVAQLKKIFLRKDSIRRQMAEHSRDYSALASRQKSLEKKLRLSKTEKFIFKTARTFMYLKALRTDVRHKVNYAFDKIFSELSKRFDYPLQTFRYSARDEIARCLQGENIDAKKISARRAGMFQITENKIARFLPYAVNRRNLPELLVVESAVGGNSVEGQSAFVGKARGRAKIVDSIRDMSKVKKGDVLIAVSTNPDILPAMQKAAAFVTDVGGITSHAAIVAREMKKPCVIAAKFATKIFKDGDLVEVDAFKGTVKKV